MVTKATNIANNGLDDIAIFWHLDHGNSWGW